MTTSEPTSRRLEWTGERCVPWLADTQIIYEHLHRYLFAAELARGRRVLDLGSGEGYGTACLAGVASEVLGIELEPAAVDHARLNYPLGNVEFRQGSVLELDELPDASFDLVVCFEMIEHIEEHDALVSEVARLLRQNGIFIVSTPDRETYTEAADFHNPFHVRELSRPELVELLVSRFSHAALWGQSVLVGSALRRLDGRHEAGTHQEFMVERSGDTWHQAEPGPPVYLVAIASQSELPPCPEFSVLDHIDRNTLIEHLRQEAFAHATALEHEREAHHETVAQLTQMSADTQRTSVELDEITGSRAWRTVSAYRRARQRFIGVVRHS
jgi:SAM-dependent methyltransferase